MNKEIQTDKEERGAEQFNAHISSYRPEQTHDLCTPWVLFQQIVGEEYNDETIKMLCSFDTLEKMFLVTAYYNISNVLGLKKDFSLSIFREGIQPLWEDPKNEMGGDLFFKQNLSSIQIAKTWELLIFVALGETFIFSDKINGVRCVMKSNKPRFEVWFSEPDSEKQVETIDMIAEEFKMALKNSSKIMNYEPNFDVLGVRGHHPSKQYSLSNHAPVKYYPKVDKKPNVNPYTKNQNNNNNTFNQQQNNLKQVRPNQQNNNNMSVEMINSGPNNFKKKFFNNKRNQNN
jgi:hypothetical protein